MTTPPCRVSRRRSATICACIARVCGGSGSPSRRPAARLVRCRAASCGCRWPPAAARATHGYMMYPYTDT
eukprot:7336760-Prymnesium_polylepis.1